MYAGSFPGCHQALGSADVDSGVLPQQVISLINPFPWRLNDHDADLTGVIDPVICPGSPQLQRSRVSLPARWFSGLRYHWCPCFVHSIQPQI